MKFPHHSTPLFNSFWEVKTMLIKEVSKSNSSSVMLITGAFIVTATLMMIYLFSK